MRQWQSVRTDIPETWWDAAVYLDKVKNYLKQVAPELYYGSAFAILRDAHERINAELWNRSEYVSTYRCD